MPSATAQELIAAMKASMEHGEVASTKVGNLYSVDGFVDFDKMAAELNRVPPRAQTIDYGDPADMWPPRHQ